MNNLHKVDKNKDKFRWPFTYTYNKLITVLHGKNGNKKHYDMSEGTWEMWIVSHGNQLPGSAAFGYIWKETICIVKAIEKCDFPFDSDFRNENGFYRRKVSNNWKLSFELSSFEKY